MFATCAQVTSPAGRRDSALLAVLYGAGLRRSEAVGLDVTDYEPEAGGLSVRCGKGKKERMCYVAAGAREAINDWLGVRGLIEGPLLLPVGKGGRIALRRMTAQAVYSRLKSIATRAGIRGFSPHDLRRTFVADLLDAGADISLVQQLVGHANVTTTQKYDRRPERAKQKAAGLLFVPYCSRSQAR